MSSLPITQAFALPSAEELRTKRWVIRIDEIDPDGPEAAQLVKDYVVTPAVGEALPKVLSDMRQVRDRGEEYGRFVHGSFGSGKSHFMTMLALLLEGSEVAWSKEHPVFAQIRKEQRDWVRDAKFLVARLHMLSVRGRTTGFDRAVYEAVNRKLELRGKAPFQFLNVEGVFTEVRREAEAYGDVVWARLQQAGILGGRSDFEALAEKSERARENFARAWLAHKGRSPEQAGLDPRWGEGLKRLTEHVQAQGYGGLVLLVDELLLWLAEKSGQEFVREINDLNTMVDHNTGQRAIPLFVFAAIQRDLREFFPDLVDESKIHEHIDHHSERFKPYVKLQDVELRHIVKGRVLVPKDPAAVESAVALLAEQHRKILPALLAGTDVEYLKDVYPFHPALIETLVDVTALMQRERTALRLLYELLVLHCPELPLGQFVPVGSAFDAIFPRAGVEASKKVELMQDIHREYYQRLGLAIEQLAGEQSDLAGERRKALEQLVKTVLLAEVSPRLKGSGLTIERLVQLNSVDVEGETFRGRVRVAETDLLALAQKVPDLQVAGSGKTAVVRYILGRVSLGEILARARSKVDNDTQRFKVFWAALKKQLDIDGKKGFEEGAQNDGDWDLTWRRTRRRGQLKLGNVREMSYNDFEPPAGAFRILIDYPWDEPGQSVEADRSKARNVRKERGNKFTVCWLPRHFSPAEMSLLIDLAAVRYLLTDAGQEDLLETLSGSDRTKVLEQAGVRENTLKGQLEGLLREVYIEHGEFLAIVSDVDGSRPRETLSENLEHIATLLMDWRYPQHPHFLAEPKRADLERLLDWMVNAGDTNVSIAYDEATGKVLKTHGQPLELVNLGQTKASLRLDTRYIKDVLGKAEGSVPWEPIAEHLRDQYGLQPLVIDLFLAFLCRRDHRALDAMTGEPVPVAVGATGTRPLRLERGQVLEAAEWHRLRELGHQLFGVDRPTAHRSLQAQDRFAAALKDAGRNRREKLQGVHQRLVHLGVEAGPRLDEIATANGRLAPLAENTSDSCKVLRDLLSQWSDDSADPMRTLVRDVDAVGRALEVLDTHALENLRAGRKHKDAGAEAANQVAAFEKRLAARESDEQLSRDWVESWNRTARDVVKRLIATPTPTPSIPDPVAPPVTMTHTERVILRATLDPRDGDAVSAFLGKVRQALSRVEGGAIHVALIRDEEDA